MRLFVAIPLPADIAAAASAAIAPLAALRPVRPELLHLTLAFCGAVPDGRVGDAVAAVEAAGAAHRAFGASVAGIGSFPAGRDPRVVWLGISDGAPDLAALASTVRGELARRSVEFDPKPFRPHVTLARVRERAAPADVRRAAGAVANATFAPRRFEVSGMLVLESHLSPKGPRYTPRAAVPLGVGRR